MPVGDLRLFSGCLQVYDGVHFLLSPIDILPTLALTMFAAQHGKARGRRVLRRCTKMLSNWANLLLLTCGLAACGHSGPRLDGNSREEEVPRAPAGALDQSADLQSTEVRLAPEKGDIDEMGKRRQIRALVSLSQTTFFFDNGRPRGMTYDALMEFEKFLNHKLHPNDRTGKEKIHIVLVPATPEKAASDLLNGYGDIIATAIYITDDRKKIADFVPVASSKHDVIVSGPSAPALTSLHDLSGKEVYVFKESLAWEKLVALNKTLASERKAEINLVPADNNLEPEDILEMTSAGSLRYSIVPSHLAQLWKNVLPGLKIYEDFPVTDKMESGWVVRKDSPKLRASLEEFANTHREGTTYFAVLANTYLKNTRFIKNNADSESARRFHRMQTLFKKYGKQYDFPWMLIAAQAYQESGLNQDARGPTGAVGVMQVMPTTAAKPPISIPNVRQLAPNIDAGVKLLKYIRDDYFRDDPMDSLNKTLITLAAYNAGPARLKQCRRLTADMGLDPNVWFHNVEYAVAKKVGAETVNYVGNIYKYYLGWQLMSERAAARARAKKLAVRR
jgi:membrane-bound lytic murein transglycosylase MltF